MRVFVATSRTQGARATDVDGCLDGELVWIEASCPPSEHRAETCGRCRHFTGLVTGGAVTTAEVRDLAAMTPERYRDAVRAGLADTGRTAASTEGTARAAADETADSLAGFAAIWRVDTVLERAADAYRPRQERGAASPPRRRTGSTP